MPVSLADLFMRSIEPPEGSVQCHRVDCAGTGAKVASVVTFAVLV